MPQGVGYPTAVLAGPDGRPAMEPGSNVPLTIEALLARRGMLGTLSGNVNMSANQAYSAGMPVQGGGQANVTSSGARVPGSAVGEGAGPASLDGSDGVTNNAAPVPSQEQGMDMMSLVPPDTTPEEFVELEEASLMDEALVGTGIAGGAYLGMKLMELYNRRGMQPPPSVASRNPVYGDELSPNRLSGPGEVVDVSPEPTVQGVLKDRKAGPRARADRAARGSPVDVGTIAGVDNTPAAQSEAFVEMLRRQGLSMRGDTRGRRGAVEGERLDAIERTTNRQAAQSSTEKALRTRRPARIPRVRP